MKDLPNETDGTAAFKMFTWAFRQTFWLTSKKLTLTKMLPSLIYSEHNSSGGSIVTLSFSKVFKNPVMNFKELPRVVTGSLKKSRKTKTCSQKHS